MSKTSKNPPEPPRSSRASQARPPGAPGVGRSQDVERALALRAVMDHVVQVQREITAPRKLRPSRARLIGATLLCIPLLAGCLYSWSARPELIWGPRPRSVPVVRQDANLRFAMFLLGQRVKSYRKAEGAYPSSIAAVGSGVQGVTYALVSDSVFELRAVEQGKRILYRSDEPTSRFLNGAATIVAGQSR